MAHTRIQKLLGSVVGSIPAEQLAVVLSAAAIEPFVFEQLHHVFRILGIPIALDALELDGIQLWDSQSCFSYTYQRMAGWKMGNCIPLHQQD